MDSSMTASAVMEGFLCPVCRRDLGSFHQLQSHFETEHSSAEQKQLFGQIKGLFGNVKKALNVAPVAAALNPFESETADSDGGYVPKRNLLLTPPQPAGITTDHTSAFRATRSKRLNQFVIQSNSIVIRLQKLVNFAPVDPRLRREFEKELVPWIDDAQVNLCPGCGRKFLPAVRKKHHCRLCGAVMCEECSINLEMQSAHKVVRDIFRDTDQPVSSNADDASSESGSIAVNRYADDGQIVLVKMCQPCWHLVERRARAKHRSRRDASDAVLDEEYTQLRSEIESADQLFRKYEIMAVALRHGDDEHDESIDLDEANRLRTRLCATFEHIDTASKQLLVHSTATNDTDAGVENLLTRNMILRRKIRQLCVDFLQRRCLVTMTPLPTLEDLRNSKAQREAEKRKRWTVEKEKQQAREDHQRRPSSSASTNSSEVKKKSEPKQKNGVTRGRNLQSKPSGFIPEPLNPFMFDEEEQGDDPLLLQMTQVREYLQQARTANKRDEVRMLEENLALLNEAYQQQKLASSADDSGTSSISTRISNDDNA